MLGSKIQVPLACELASLWPIGWFQFCMCEPSVFWLGAWIQDEPMLTLGLQLYNCPSCMHDAGKWLKKKEQTESVLHPPLSPTSPAPSQDLYFTGMSAAGMWRILYKRDEKATCIIHITSGHGWPFQKSALWAPVFLKSPSHFNHLLIHFWYICYNILWNTVRTWSPPNKLNDLISYSSTFY